VVSTPAMLAPTYFVPNRSAAAAAAALTIHPGMGRLASNMSVKSGRGNHLPAWATDAPAAQALAAGMYRTLIEQVGLPLPGVRLVTTVVLHGPYWLSSTECVLTAN
jgi:hypothetical protein